MKEPYQNECDYHEGTSLYMYYLSQCGLKLDFKKLGDISYKYTKVN